jgi:hypothetical protein
MAGRRNRSGLQDEFLKRKTAGLLPAVFVE